MAMVDCGGAEGGTEGHTIQVVSHRQVPQERRTKEVLTCYKIDSLGELWNPRGTGARQ